MRTKQSCSPRISLRSCGLRRLRFGMDRAELANDHWQASIGNNRSPGERSDTRDVPACRCAHAGYAACGSAWIAKAAGVSRFQMPCYKLDGVRWITSPRLNFVTIPALRPANNNRPER